MGRRIVARFLFILLAFVSSRASLTLPSSAQDASAAVNLKIAGVVSMPLALTIEGLKKMPRKTLSILTIIKPGVYEGV